MKILSIYRYYWPDTTPYARILRSILERLAEEGHTPVVLTGQPTYNDIRHDRQPAREFLDGVDVRRVRLLPERKWMGPLRALNFLLFLGRGCLHTVFHRYDIVLASSNPPVISGLALRLIRWFTGAQYVYHCQDLHPECAVLANKLSSGRFERWLRHIDTNNCRQAARTVVLSDDMAQTIRDRELLVTRIGIINNFALDIPAPSMNELPPPFDDDSIDLFRVFFAGNMGSFQGLEKVISAAKLLEHDPSIRFVFMGAGEQKDNLTKQAGSLLDRTVHFLPFQPVDKAYGCMHRAELGVVSLIPGVYKVAFPSKTMMYLAAGCPVLAIIEPQSVLANQLTDRRIGWVPAQTTPRAIADSILAARDEHRSHGTDRERIQQHSSELFDRDRTLDQWAALFAELKSADARRGPSIRQTTQSTRRAA